VALPDALADWFARRTFTADELDLRDLIALKRVRDVSVSLVLPARNEAQTVRGVVDSGMALAGQLVDEIVVLDGGSTDGTAELAVAAGATVHQDSEILPHVGPALGKGDALWRSLAVTSGDIVAFVDTDIRNPDPRFVWGIIAPLLLDDAIGFVKGFYDRPLDDQGGGGGRVTELVARPLLSLLFPDLAGFVQPLAGEYAARREVAESLPFVRGYGVDIGLLIDVAERFGRDTMAQVDLDIRVDRNRPLDELSPQAMAIIQTVLRRAGSRLSSTTAVLNRPGSDPVEVDVSERPALVDVPTYRRRFF
jgi:glucosyl-3-phosphoglycerate synthase